MSDPITYRPARRRDPYRVFLAAMLMAVLVTGLSFFGAKLFVDSRPLPDETAIGNSLYVDQGCVPVYLESGVSSSVCQERVYGVRAVVVNPGRCYLLDGGVKLGPRGNLPAFHYLGDGNHSLSGC